MKTLVTGGAGFIGSHVVDALLARGHEVVIVDNLSTGLRRNINPQAKFYELDIRDPALSTIFETERPDIVNHHAAHIDVRGSVKTPRFDADVNVIGTLNLLECSRRSGIRKIIYSSSGGAIYGEPEYLPCDEAHPIRPICQYGVSKHVVEQYLYVYQQLYGLESVILRYANVYGPRQDPHGETGVVAIYIWQMLGGESVTINGTGDQERDFIYVGDCARANVLATEDGKVGTYNVGYGQGTSIKTLFSEIARITSYSQKPKFAASPAGETFQIFLDSLHIRENLGWMPSVDLEEGLKRTVAHFQERVVVSPLEKIDQFESRSEDRRTLERKDLIYYFSVYDSQANHPLGHVANISSGGLMLIGREQIETKVIRQIRMHLPVSTKGRKYIEFEAESRWCSRNSHPGFFETGFKLGQITSEDLSIIEHICSNSALPSGLSNRRKRAFDLLFSFLGMLLLLPVFVVIGVILRLESSKPILFAADRVGKFGQLFKMYKFRTMDAALAHDSPKVTAHDDPRVTRIGRFLRQTKLNELPQLLNVFMGNMSFVGPRPEYEEFVEHYAPDEREVLSVKPGITSVASILYAEEERLLRFSKVTETYLRNILPDKLHLDLLYVRNRSLLLDFDILIQTVLVLIPRLREATPRAEDILSGPFRIARRHLTWFTIDAMIVFLSIGLSGVLWRSAGPFDVGAGRSLLAALVMTAIFSLTNWLSGVQRVQWRYASTADAIYVIGSAIAATVFTLVGNAILPQFQLPSQMLIMSGILATGGFLLARYHRRILADLLTKLQSHRAAASTAREKVLIVGDGELGQLVIRLLQSSPIGQAFDIIGVIDDDLNKLGTLLHRIPVLGPSDRVQEIARENGVGMIIFVNPELNEQRRSDILRRCRKSGARVVIVQDLLESFQLSGEIKADDFPTSTRYRSLDQDLKNLEA